MEINVMSPQFLTLFPPCIHQSVRSRQNWLLDSDFRTEISFASITASFDEQRLLLIKHILQQWKT